jgi:hypothetical protein
MKLSHLGDLNVEINEVASQTYWVEIVCQKCLSEGMSAHQYTIVKHHYCKASLRFAVGMFGKLVVDSGITNHMMEKRIGYSQTNTLWSKLSVGTKTVAICLSVLAQSSNATYMYTYVYMDE